MMASSPGRSQPTSSHTPPTRIHTAERAIVGDTANDESRPAKSRSKNPQWLTIDEILNDLGIPRRTWQRWRTRKQTPKMLKLPSGEYRIHRDDYKAWLNGLEVDA